MQQAQEQDMRPSVPIWRVCSAPARFSGCQAKEKNFMAGESSFDVVSQFDEQELVNALDQTRREVTTRFDLKDTKTDIRYEAKKSITITTNSEFTLKSVRDVLESKLVRRSLSLKILKPGKIEQAASSQVRQMFELQQGISQDLGREITKLIRDQHPKVRPQIQGDAVRVVGKSRDDLQAVIATLKKQDYPVELQFINYRG
jgi:uncharacterized protein YajQ (UPF0234 family)